MELKCLKWIAAGMLTLSAGAGNLIFNGGFELGTDGFALHRIVTREDGKHLPLELEGDKNKVLKIANPDGDYFEFYVSSFPLKPETKYTFSMRAKTDVKGGVPLEALIHDADWHINRKMFRIGPEFQHHSFTFKTGEFGGANVIRLWSFQRTDPGGGWKGNLWLDDLTLTSEGEESAAIHAAVSAGRRWLKPEDVKNNFLRLKIWNDSPREYRDTLQVEIRSDRDDKPVAAHTLKVALKPGEVQSLPLPGTDFTLRYGSYSAVVTGRDVRSRDFIFVVIGDYEAKPRDFDRDICVGVNGGVELRDGYVNRTLITRNGYHTHNAASEAKFELLQQAGVRLIREWDSGRLPTDWATAEPEEGKFDFTFFDSVMAKFEKYNLVPVHVLGGELFRQPYLGPENSSAKVNPIPPWALPLAERPDYHPPYAMRKLKGYIAFPPIDRWQRFMTELAKHTKGKKHYFEFTNEPNLYVTPEAYVKYLKATYEGIKAGDPAGKVAGFSVTSDFKADADSWLAGAIRAGGLAYCDILSFHPYNMRELGSFQPADRAIEMIFTLMKRGGRTLPIWNTELYYLYDTPSNSDIAQKAAKAEHLLTRFLVDCGENVSQSMPLLENRLWRWDDYLTRPGELIPSELFVAANTLARLFEAAKPVAKHRFAPGVICYVYQKDGQPIAAAWNYGKRTGVRIDLSGFEVLDLFGNPVKAGVVDLTGAPFYLLPGKRSEAEFRKACEALKPYLAHPVSASSEVRAFGNTLIIGLHNGSPSEEKCSVGFEGGGMTAKKVEVTLRPNESRAVTLPFRRVAEAGKPQILLHRPLPATVYENVSIKNGETLRLTSADGKLSADCRARLENGRFYFEAQVRDATPAGPSGERKAWETDSIELFLDPTAAQLPERFAERYPPETTRFFITPYHSRQLASWPNRPDARLEVTLNPGGYTVKLEYPLKTARLPLGFGVKINDAEKQDAKATRSVEWGVGKEAPRNRLHFGLIADVK